MTNGAGVLRADLKTEVDGTVHGWVLARHEGQVIVCYVSATADGSFEPADLHTFEGDQHDRAKCDYDVRRGIQDSVAEPGPGRKLIRVIATCSADVTETLIYDVPADWALPTEQELPDLLARLADDPEVWYQHGIDETDNNQDYVVHECVVTTARGAGEATAKATEAAT